MVACAKAPLSSMFGLFTGQADSSSVCDPAFHRNPFLSFLNPVFHPCALSNRSCQGEVVCLLLPQQGLKGLLPCDPAPGLDFGWLFKFTENHFCTLSGSSVTSSQKCLLISLCLCVARLHTQERGNPSSSISHRVLSPHNTARTVTRENITLPQFNCPHPKLPTNPLITKQQHNSTTNATTQHKGSARGVFHTASPALAALTQKQPGSPYL